MNQSQLPPKSSVERWKSQIQAQFRRSVLLRLASAFGLMILLVGVAELVAARSQPSVVPLTIESTPTPVFGPPAQPFILELPAQNISVPIVANVSGTDEQAYLAALERGVAQFDESVNPDQDGNLFIFGHSDYYKQKPGEYKQVFRNLNQLKPDDSISVIFQDRSYRYSVVRSSVVADDDWSITQPTVQGANRTLTLMTCWPPGTLEKRYVVIAKQLPNE